MDRVKDRKGADLPSVEISNEVIVHHKAIADQCLPVPKASNKVANAASINEVADNSVKAVVLAVDPVVRVDASVAVASSVASLLHDRMARVLPTARHHLHSVLQSNARKNPSPSSRKLRWQGKHLCVPLVS